MGRAVAHRPPGNPRGHADPPTTTPQPTRQPDFTTILQNQIPGRDRVGTRSEWALPECPEAHQASLGVDACCRFDNITHPHVATGQVAVEGPPGSAGRHALLGTA